MEIQASRYSGSVKAWEIRRASASTLMERAMAQFDPGAGWTAGFERFHNSRALSNVLQRGFFLVKKPLGGCGPGCSNCGTAVSPCSACCGEPDSVSTTTLTSYRGECMWQTRSE